MSVCVCVCVCLSAVCERRISQEPLFPDFFARVIYGRACSVLVGDVIIIRCVCLSLSSLSAVEQVLSWEIAEVVSPCLPRGL